MAWKELVSCIDSFRTGLKVRSILLLSIGLIAPIIYQSVFATDIFLEFDGADTTFINVSSRSGWSSHTSLNDTNTTASFKKNGGANLAGINSTSTAAFEKGGATDANTTVAFKKNGGADLAGINTTTAVAVEKGGATDFDADNATTAASVLELKNTTAVSSKNRGATHIDSDPANATTSSLQSDDDIIKRTNSSVFIFVLTRRDAFLDRQTIRETWASLHDNIYFVMGGAACHIPESAKLTPLACQAANDTNPWRKDKDLEHHLQNVESKIQNEIHERRDILYVPNVIDDYRSLPAKIKYAYQWGVENLPNALWFVKVDDDMYLRVKRFMETTPSEPEHFSKAFYKPFYRIAVLNNARNKKMSIIKKWDKSGQVNIYDPRKMALYIGGHPMDKAIVHKKGKWADPMYRPTYYPPFFGGDLGHMISRPFAEYLASHNNKLVNYQGEDCSLGIWADEAPFPILHMVDRRIGNMMNAGSWCQKLPTKVLIGHKLGVTRKRRCWERDLQNNTSVVVHQTE